jgi:hypothetical protein
LSPSIKSLLITDQEISANPRQGGLIMPVLQLELSDAEKARRKIDQARWYAMATQGRHLQDWFGFSSTLLTLRREALRISGKTEPIGGCYVRCMSRLVGETFKGMRFKGEASYILWFHSDDGSRLRALEDLFKKFPERRTKIVLPCSAHHAIRDERLGRNIHEKPSAAKATIASLQSDLLVARERAERMIPVEGRNSREIADDIVARLGISAAVRVAACIAERAKPPRPIAAVAMPALAH